jgi:putative ABC transport system permease protein
MKLHWTLAWRYLRGRAMRTALTIVAVVFGVMIVFGMNGIVPAVRASFGESVRVSAHEVDLLVTPTTDRTFGADVADEIRSVPGVAIVTQVLERSLTLPAAYHIPTNDDRAIDRLVISGWEPEGSQQVVPIPLLGGRWLQTGDTGAAMVRQSLLDRSGLALGDAIQLPSGDSSRSFTIVGVLPARPVVGDEEVIIALPEAQALLNLPGEINALAGQFTPDADGDSVRAAVGARLGEGYSLGEVEGGGQEWESVLQIAGIVFTMFGVLALAMGGFIIFNTFRTSVAERRRDIGMLRAVGASRRTILGVVLAESALLGIVGTAIGMATGYGGVRSLLPLLSPQWQRYFGAPLGEPAFAAHIYALTIALGLGVPLLSGLLPALQASRITPLEALRPVAEDGAVRGRGTRLVWGGVLIALAIGSLLTGNGRLGALGALLFLGGLVLLTGVFVQPIAALFGRGLAALLPREGHLAQRNLVRQPGRAAVTASSMMISLAILVALAGLATTFTNGLMGYLQRSMRADYLLLPEALVLGQADAEADPELAERLRSTPGIAAVTTLRRGETTIDGAAAQVIGIDPSTYPELAGLAFSAGDPDRAYAELAAGRFAIVNGVLAAQQGINVGDDVTLQTATGPQSYRVAGVGVDYLNSRVATAYVSQANLAADLGVTDDVLLMANRAADARPQAVERALLDLTRDYPAFSLLHYETWRADQLAANQTRTNIMYVLMALLAVPSLLALANTLSINVLERTREIGMLRAVGSTRGQVQRMIVAESVLLASFGILFGIVSGVVLGYALVGAMSSVGLSFAYVFPTLGIVVAIAVGLVFGVLAALLPARRATRLNIVGALRYE